MQSEEYDKLFRLEEGYWWFVGRRRLARRLLHAANPRPDRVLDLGCGTGAGLAELSESVVSVGLDPWPPALGYCRRRGLSRLVRGDGSALPFASGSFDGVVALDVYEHIRDDRAALAETWRVLRPGGVVVLSVPAFRFLWGPHDVALHHFRRYRASEVRARLEGAGFQVERLSYAVFFLFPLVLASRVLERFRPGPPRASLPPVPKALNRVLARHLEYEARLTVEKGLRLPWGSSVVAVGRKPSA
ncbi:MAG: methyltransferase domain-containing protein [Fimbriimonadaceae bacterium]|nr:methyltransferase domain-containing protein [Fimbriimonadaceae bacterium]QYK56421.1 MAG: methyltransferase domain-containing protein [Fimbriimonadaceae bacterium]